MADRPVTAQPDTRAQTDYVVRSLDDIDEIRELLTPHRAYAAYALGQLQPGLVEKTEWHLARGAGGEALVLHSRGGLGNALFALGAGEPLEAVLQIYPGPHNTFLTCQPSQRETALRHFVLPGPSEMARLHVNHERFQPVDGDVRRVTGSEVHRINGLYRADGTAAFYTAANIDRAIYYGAYDEGRMVAVAGTHVVSELDEIGVVGNVFTHPQYRGMGYGRMVTSAVTRDVLETCREAVLSVDPANVAAVRAYEGLGYHEVAHLIEGPAVGRNIGPGAFVRRRWAAIRGRRYGGKLVSLSR
jgi:ribosomal protein S18 acetylase RimI-like enzyme